MYWNWCEESNYTKEGAVTPCRTSDGGRSGEWRGLNLAPHAYVHSCVHCVRAPVCVQAGNFQEPMGRRGDVARDSHERYSERRRRRPAASPRASGGSRASTASAGRVHGDARDGGPAAAA